MHRTGAVLKASQCLTAALQGNTNIIRRAARGGRPQPLASSTGPQRCLLTAAGLVHRMVPQSQSSGIQTVTSDFLSEDDIAPGVHLHLILLNYILPAQTAQLWQRAATRICADGGANRLYDQVPVMVPSMDAFMARETHLPDLIKGDLDSVRQDVTDFYTSRGVPFIDLSSDQDTTDLEKCLLFLEGRLRAMSEAAVRQPVAEHVAVAAGSTQRRASATGHGARAIATARASTGSLARSSSSNGSSSTTLGGTSSSGTAVGLAPLTPNSALADPSYSSSQQQQPVGQIYGEILMMPGVQDRQQRQQQMSSQAADNGQPSNDASNSWGPQQAAGCSGADGVSGQPSSGNSNGGGGRQHDVHEVTASILASHDTAGDGESVRKRVQQEHQILVLGALGGRLDHTLANLNTLYCYRHLNITLWGDGNLVRLLRSGKSIIKPSRLEGPTCGLVPLARPAIASSKGLKWDLDETHMCFRGLLSTSNIISSDTIEVTTDEDLLWITAVGDTMLPAGRSSR